MGKLDGIRVIDLSRVLAGPYCTALLADIGADVVKVEAPDRGDDARHFGPYQQGESIYFAILNRSKKSVTLNLKHERGLELLYDLVGTADVLVENFRPGVTRRLGIDYERLAERNPRLIYASISGFGQNGPFADRPAYDLVVQATSGLMSITGQPDGPPTRVGESLGDLTAGLFAAWGICAALMERERTGRGQHVDVAMFDALLSFQVTAFSQFAVTGQAPGRVGNRHPVSTPFDSFQAKDGLVVLVAANQAMFARLAGVLGQPELADDPRFATDHDRTSHEPELKRIIEEWTVQHTVDEVVAAASAAGVPAAPIWDLAEAAGSEQAMRRDLVTSFEHPVAGQVRVVPQPIRFGDDRRPRPNASPGLGEHTDEVLGGLLGVAADELTRLRGEGAV